MHAHNTSRHWASAAAAFCLSCSLHLCDSPAALAQTATAPVRPGTEFKGAARVVDGDTLVVRCECAPTRLIRGPVMGRKFTVCCAPCIQ